MARGNDILSVASVPFKCKKEHFHDGYRLKYYKLGGKVWIGEGKAWMLGTLRSLELCKEWICGSDPSCFEGGVTEQLG